MSKSISQSLKFVPAAEGPVTRAELSGPRVECFVCPRTGGVVAHVIQEREKFGWEPVLHVAVVERRQKQSFMTMLHWTEFGLN